MVFEQEASITQCYFRQAASWPHLSVRHLSVLGKASPPHNEGTGEVRAWIISGKGIPLCEASLLVTGPFLIFFWSPFPTSNVLPEVTLFWPLLCVPSRHWNVWESLTEGSLPSSIARLSPSLSWRGPSWLISTSNKHHIAVILFLCSLPGCMSWRLTLVHCITYDLVPLAFKWVWPMKVTRSRRRGSSSCSPPWQALCPKGLPCSSSWGLGGSFDLSRGLILGLNSWCP